MKVTLTSDGGIIIDNPDRVLMALLGLETRLDVEIRTGMTGRVNLLRAAQGWGAGLGCDRLAKAKTRKAALAEIRTLRAQREVEMFGEEGK